MLFPLHFDTHFRCAASSQLLTTGGKVVALKSTGKVFLEHALPSMAVSEIAIDPVDRSTFCKTDIVVLFDPGKHIWMHNGTQPLGNYTPLSLRRTPIKRSVHANVTGGERTRLYKESDARVGDRRVRNQLEHCPVAKRIRKEEVVETRESYHKRIEEEERKLVYKRIRKGKKGKGYVRVVTNIGHLNIELHCDKVPMACDNFLTLAERNYYDNNIWHRIVPGFIAQTGDPTGTGNAGESAWGGYVKDEIRTSLTHDSAGIVSMANSGKDTNRSQWFVCLAPAKHLDGAHTVFGKVVGGLFLLKKMEKEAELGRTLTVERIEVLVNPIRQIREGTNPEKQKRNKLTITREPASRDMKRDIDERLSNVTDGPEVDKNSTRACSLDRLISPELPPLRSIMPPHR